MKAYTANMNNQVVKVLSKGAVAGMILVGSLSAHALLPTPEPEAAGLTRNTTAYASSATNNNIQTKTVAAIVNVDAQGRQSLQPIAANTRVNRGDIIEYRSYLTNTSNDRIRNMTVTMSIPPEVRLVGEVTPTSASASLDGAQFGRMPLRGQINGQIQDVPLKYYKQLRWTLEGLGINETAMVKYRTQVR